METITALSSRTLQFYVIARRWASDLEFYKIETAFFNRLLDDYFTRLTDADHFEKLKHTAKLLLKLEDDRVKTLNLLNEQIKYLELMAEDIVPENVDELRGKQIKLEYMVSTLTKEFRSTKQDLFALIESVAPSQGRFLAN